MEQAKVNPYVAVFFGVIAVSFSSLFVKLSDANSFIIAFYRLFITFLILLPIAWKEKIAGLREITLKDGLLACLSGTFLAVHFVVWFISLEYTSVASSVVLVTTQPIWVVVGSYIFFREKIGFKALLGGAIALLGGIMIGVGDFEIGGKALLGDILALAGAVAVSGYLVIGRRIRSRVDLPVYTFLAYGSSSIILGLTAAVADTPFYPYPMREWALFFGLAFVCTVLGHTVFNWTLKYVQASVVAVAVLGEPLGAILWAAVFLRENPTLQQLVSGAVIILGLYIFTKYTRQDSPAGQDGLPGPVGQGVEK